MHMIGNQRDIQCKRQPLASDKKEDVEKSVKNILWKHQRIEAVALIDRILIVRLQLVESNNLRNEQKKVLSCNPSKCS